MSVVDVRREAEVEAPNPSLIFETLNAHQRTAALRAAIDLDIFSAVGRGHRTATDIATYCHGHARATRILCDFLTVHGFLTKGEVSGNDEYGLTPVSAQFLDRQSPQYIGSIANFLNSTFQREAFRDLAEVVRRGRTLLDGDGAVEVEFDGWVEFARSMVPMMIPPAQFIAAEVAKRRPGPVRILDVAAGHGIFGIELAKQNPQASVVALDWPKVLEVALENAVAAGVADRYTALPGDALAIDYGQGFDIVLATNIFHHFDRPTCEKMMRKMHDCLVDNGLVITLEFIPNEDRVTPPLTATFSMMMLATTPAGDAYTYREYAEMFETVGLNRSELLPIPNSPQQVLVTQR